MTDELKRGTCELSSGHLLEAVVLFRQAASKDPNHGNCELAAALAKLGRYDDAQVPLFACRTLPPAERPPFTQLMAQHPENFAPHGSNSKPTPPADCKGCGEVVLAMPKDVEPDIVLEEMDLVFAAGGELPIFSNREAVGRPSAMPIWTAPVQWRVRTLWKRGHQSAYMLSDQLGATEIGPFNAALVAPGADDFTDAPVRPIPFTPGLELYTRLDVTPLSPAGGAANVGLAYLLGYGFEPAAAAVLSPQLFGLWLGGAELQPVSQHVRLGVVAGVPWYLARVADRQPRLPENFAGIHLAAATRVALGNGRSSLFFAAGGQYYPSLRADHFRRTLLVLSLGFQFGL